MSHSDIKVSLIAAMSKDRVIGRDGDLPWDISEDLQYFLRMTQGKPCVMGRKTYESLPIRPLPKRPNIVITRDEEYSVPESVHLTTNLDDALEKAKELAYDRGTEEVMVMGGGEIYKQSIDDADRLYLTEINMTVNDGDTFFPEFSRREWREVSRETIRDHYPVYSFVIYERN